jgi:CO dehydrogenase/acetyl-CoA synthase beta subunit
LLDAWGQPGPCSEFQTNLDCRDKPCLKKKCTKEEEEEEEEEEGGEEGKEKILCTAVTLAKSCSSLPLLCSYNLRLQHRNMYARFFFLYP